MLLLVLVYSTGDAWRLIWYQVDRDSFAERFCENIERPELQCHGSCQLQDLASENNPLPGAEAPAGLQELRLPGPFLLSFTSLPSLSPDNDRQSGKMTFLSFYAHSYSWAPFRPPA